MIEADRLDFSRRHDRRRRRAPIAPFARKAGGICRLTAGALPDGDLYSGGKPRGDALDHLLIFGPPC